MLLIELRSPVEGMVSNSIHFKWLTGQCFHEVSLGSQPYKYIVGKFHGRDHKRIRQTQATMNKGTDCNQRGSMSKEFEHNGEVKGFYLSVYFFFRKLEKEFSIHDFRRTRGNCDIKYGLRNDNNQIDIRLAASIVAVSGHHVASLAPKWPNERSLANQGSPSRACKESFLITSYHYYKYP